MSGRGTCPQGGAAQPPGQGALTSRCVLVLGQDCKSTAAGLVGVVTAVAMHRAAQGQGCRTSRGGPHHSKAGSGHLGKGRPDCTQAHWISWVLLGRGHHLWTRWGEGSRPEPDSGPRMKLTLGPLRRRSRHCPAPSGQPLSRAGGPSASRTWTGLGSCGPVQPLGAMCLGPRQQKSQPLLATASPSWAARIVPQAGQASRVPEGPGIMNVAVAGGGGAPSMQKDWSAPGCTERTVTAGPPPTDRRERALARPQMPAPRRAPRLMPVPPSRRLFWHVYRNQ